MIKSNIIIEVEIADNGVIIRQTQSDGSPIVEVVEGEDYKVEKKLGTILYTELLNELCSSSKHKVTITLDAL